MDLIERPSWSEDRKLEYFFATADDALSRGLTAVHDAGLSPLPVPLLMKWLIFFFQTTNTFNKSFLSDWQTKTSSQ
jgi:hypothetical protein